MFGGTHSRMRPAPDQAPEEHEKMHQQRDRIGLGVRRDRAHDGTSQAIEGRIVEDGPAALLALRARRPRLDGRGPRGPSWLRSPLTLRAWRLGRRLARLRPRSRRDELLEPLPRAASVQPVGHVGAVGAIRVEVERAHRCGYAAQSSRHLRAVPAARLVRIHELDHVVPAEDLRRMFRHQMPLLGALGRRGRTEPEGGETVRVFLALADVDRLRGWRGEQLGQAVEHAPHALHVPDPAAGAVRPPLGEALVSPPHHLEDERSMLVAVVVLRGDRCAPASVPPLHRRPVGPRLAVRLPAAALALEPMHVAALTAH